LVCAARQSFVLAAVTSTRPANATSTLEKLVPEISGGAARAAETINNAAMTASKRADRLRSSLKKISGIRLLATLSAANMP
jgi:hypothetical protein